MAKASDVSKLNNTEHLWRVYRERVERYKWIDERYANFDKMGIEEQRRILDEAANRSNDKRRFHEREGEVEDGEGEVKGG